MFHFILSYPFLSIFQIWLGHHCILHDTGLLLTLCPFLICVEQICYDAVEAFRVSYKRINPFTIPLATTNMSSAILAVDLVCV